MQIGHWFSVNQKQIYNPPKIHNMRKADLVNQISEKTGIPKVDVLVTLETMFKEVKDTLADGENIYIRGLVDLL